MNFNFISFVIPYHLAKSNYSPVVVGSIFLTSIPYCLKVFLAPFIDKYSIVFLCPKLGQRRGWAIMIQCCLSISVSIFSFIDPTKNLTVTAIITLLISLFSALQDIVLDAYRIERASSESEISIASTFVTTGFRTGMLIGSSGALYIAHLLGWKYVYLSVLIFSLSGLLILYCIDEPQVKKDLVSKAFSFKEYINTIKVSALMLKDKNQMWFLIILFIFFYKSSDSITMAMSTPLFVDLSFTALEIAYICKLYGLLLMILGGAIGGWLISKIGIFKGILIFGTAQLMSPIMFAILAIVGHNIPLFIFVVSIQSFCSGLCGVALIIYFSTLCESTKLVGTQFSLVSSFSSFTRLILSSISGLLTSYLKWPQFFFFNALIGLLFLPLFLIINSKNKKLSINKH